MKTNKLIFLFLIFSGLILLTGMVLLNNRENQNKQYYFFEDPVECSGCHWDRFDRWSVSQHSKGFTGDFFQAQFYDLVLPSLGLDEKAADAHEDCIGCHSPSAYLSGDMVPPRTNEPDNHWNPAEYPRTRAERGVFCDFCHTLMTIFHMPRQRWIPNALIWPSHGRHNTTRRCLKYMRQNRFVLHVIMN